VLVAGVDKAGPFGAAEERGRAPGDVIERVRRDPVTTPADLARLTRTLSRRGAGEVALLVAGARGPRRVAPRLGPGGWLASPGLRIAFHPAGDSGRLT